MNLARQFALLVITAVLGLGLAACQPSDPKTPVVAQLSSVAIAGGAVSLDVGGAASLVLTGTYSDGTTSDVSFNASFISSAPAIVSVTATGSLKGMAPGTATITATHTSGKTATTTVTVAPLRVTAIAVTNTAPVNVTPNGTLQLVVTGTFNNAITGNVTAGATFISSNTAVASVSAAGVVTGVSLGIATINVTHTASGKTTTIGITVVEPPRPTTAPTTVIPSGSVTIYSDAATIANFIPNPDWGQSPPVAFSDVTIAGNKSLRYGWAGPGGLYEGLDWNVNPVDVSAKAKLHLDFWTPDLTSVKVSIISAGKENAFAVTLTALSWNGVDIYFWGTAAGVSCGTTAPTCAPTTVIPAGSLTIYSDATSITGLLKNPDWGQNPPVVFSEPTIAGNKSLQYTFGGTALYEGIDWAGNPVNVSTKGKLHLDFWTSSLTSVKVSIISAGKENFFTVPLTSGSWNGVDIDLSNYTVPDLTAIIQIKLEPNAAGTLYVDNIYFWGTAGVSCGTTAPTCAPSTVIPAGSITIYSDATSITGLLKNPDWGQNPPVVFNEPTIAGNKSLQYTFGGTALYEGIDWAANPVNVTTKTNLHLDFWTPGLTSVKVSIISVGAENAVTVPVTSGSWNSINIPLSSYTVPNKTAIIQIKLEPNAAGALYVDNIYFN